MDQAAITQYIIDTFEGTSTDTSTPDTFFLYDPERKFPFATIVTRDNDFDHASNLNRPSVFRLNIGISKATFQSLFSEGEGGRDFTALDRLMPHPMYARMYWACVLNPSAETFEAVKPLLAEAYELAVERYGKREVKSPPATE
jgi:hypothetical protein